MTNLTAERLRELINYDPLTGIFTRRIDRGKKWKAGSICGSHSRDGRMQINIDRRNYQLSRIAWLHVTGEWPNGDVDHIDGNPANNAFSNLRDVPHQTNAENRRRATRINRTGYLGVVAHQGRFMASITLNGKTKFNGTYLTALEAHNAYLEAKRQYHKGCTI